MSQVPLCSATNRLISSAFFVFYATFANGLVNYLFLGHMTNILIPFITNPQDPFIQLILENQL